MGGCYSALSRSTSSDVLSFDAHDTDKTIKRPPNAPSFTGTITVQGSDDHNSRLNVDILGSPNNGANFSSRYRYYEDHFYTILFGGFSLSTFDNTV